MFIRNGLLEPELLHKKDKIKWNENIDYPETTDTVHTKSVSEITFEVCDEYYYIYQNNSPTTTVAVLEQFYDL